MEKLEWDTLESRRKHNRLTMLYKIMSNEVGINKNNFDELNPHSSSRKSNSESLKNHLHVHKNSFFPRTSRDWNYAKRVTLVYLYHINRWDTHKKLSIAKLDFVQVCGLSLNFYNNTLRKFYNSGTVGRLEQVQLCNRRIAQSADNITGLKCAKECLILKYKYIQNP